MGKDIYQSLLSLGHEVSVINFVFEGFSMSNVAVQNFNSAISNQKFDFVISINYFPEISNICEATNTKYASWTYDAPCATLYDNSVTNSCNYIFSFDKNIVSELSLIGVKNIYYLPLAVESCFINEDFTTSIIKKHDVTFVGSLYSEKLDLFNKCYDALSDYLKGYLLSIINTQVLLDEYFILEDSITAEIEQLIRQNVKIDPPVGYLMNYKSFFANYILGAKSTSLQRIRILNEVANELPITIFTTSRDEFNNENIRLNGPIDHDRDLASLYKSSKINLNITMSNIQNGIPLRCFDILGSGGFLLTNHRTCFSELFTENEDFVYFYNMSDLKNKIKYYLSHENERKEIAFSGMQKARKMHSVPLRVNNIINTLFP